MALTWSRDLTQRELKLMGEICSNCDTSNVMFDLNISQLDGERTYNNKLVKSLIKKQYLFKIEDMYAINQRLFPAYTYKEICKFLGIENRYVPRIDTSDW